MQTIPRLLTLLDEPSKREQTSMAVAACLGPASAFESESVQIRHSGLGCRYKKHLGCVHSREESLWCRCAIVSQEGERFLGLRRSRLSPEHTCRAEYETGDGYSISKHVYIFGGVIVHLTLPKLVFARVNHYRRQRQAVDDYSIIRMTLIWVCALLKSRRCEINRYRRSVGEISVTIVASEHISAVSIDAAEMAMVSARLFYFCCYEKRELIIS